MSPFSDGRETVKQPHEVCFSKVANGMASLSDWQIKDEILCGSILRVQFENFHVCIKSYLNWDIIFEEMKRGRVLLLMKEEYMSR